MLRFVKYVLVLLLGLFSVIALSCSASDIPSDEEVIKAIHDSGVLNRDGFVLTAPVAIVEKGRKQGDGSWPVKVKLTLAMKGMSEETKEIVTISDFKIQKSKNSAGASVWKAILNRDK